jgi:AcrR family transcriptional regulator
MTLPSPPSTPTTSGKSPGSPTSKNRKRVTNPEDGRLVRGRRSRAIILAAARELFSEKGFDGATLRDIAKRAGMGVSSLYRHIQSKEELLVGELVAKQEQAWIHFRSEDQAGLNARQRIGRWVSLQHELLSLDPDFSRVALRASTHPQARVAKEVLALNDRSIGLIAEILMKGRMSDGFPREVDLMTAAQAVFYITNSARIPWANGVVSDEACLKNTLTAVDLLFQGLEARNA